MTRTESEFLAYYVGLGLTDIVVVDYEYHEQRSGLQVENTSETIVARREDRFVLLRVHEQVHPLRPRDFSSGAEVQISAEEYARQAGGKLKADSELELQRLRDAQERLRIASDASARLKQSAPNCPRCGAKLSLRYARHGPFWGCERYPNCKGTSSFTHDQMKLHAVISAN